MKIHNKSLYLNRGAAGRAIAFALAVLMLTLAFMLCRTENVHAAPRAMGGQTAEEGVEGGAYEVKAYDLHAKVKKDHSYTVKEVISVDIPDQLQKIEFAIPSGNFRVSDIKVENAEYSGGRLQDAGKVSITDAEKLSAGPHKYTISYRIQEYDDRDSTKDMFFFNVLLPEWRQPIGKVSIKVDFPEDFPFDDMQCYAGQFGVQDTTNKIGFSADGKNKSVSVSGKLIPENYGITLKAQLPEGYWKGELNSSWALIAIAAAMVAVVLLLTLLWIIGGKDPKVKKEQVTKPVEGFSPVELGYVFDSHVSIRDIINMILEFAVKDYLRISEYEPKTYRIYRGKEPAGEERMYRSAYNILFEDIFRNRAIEMEEFTRRLVLIRRSIADDIASGFSAPESSPFTPLSRVLRYMGAAMLGTGLALANIFSFVYLYQSPNYIGSVIIGILAAAASLLLCYAVDGSDSASISSWGLYEIAAGAIAAVPVLCVSINVLRRTGNPLIAFLVVALSAAALFFIVIMRARGRENAELISKIRQLRHFIYHPTPKELLENHLADENYYYDMLIYALAFGAEESWAISFLTLDVKEPRWFTDDTEGHAYSNLNVRKETVDYARDIKSFVRTVENAYSDVSRHSGRNK